MSRRLALLSRVLRLTVKRRFGRVSDPQQARREFAVLARLLFGAPPFTLRLPDRLGPGVTARAAGAVTPGAAGGGVPGLWVSSGMGHDRRGAQEAILLYLHGGAYLAGSPDTHAALLARLSRLSDLRGFAPDYRLAPEHPFPAAFEDVLTAWDGLLARGYAPGRIVIAGDSAGGGLALALLAELCLRGTPPAAVLAMSPVTDLTSSGASMSRNAARDAMLPAGRLDELVDLYLAGVSPRDPRASPLYADFPGAPPAIIQVSDAEILLDDARRMAERLRGFGAAVTLQVWPGAPHVWQMFDGWVPEARAALRDLADFARAALDLPARVPAAISPPSGSTADS